MPQISPMWWLSLMLIFNTMIMVNSTMVYFNNYKKKNYKNNIMNKKLMWMW